jgi:hypothetical protein
MPNLWALLFALSSLSEAQRVGLRTLPFPGPHRLQLLCALFEDPILQDFVGTVSEGDHSWQGVCKARALQFLRTPSTHCGYADVLILAVALGVDIQFWRPKLRTLEEFRAGSVSGLLASLDSEQATPRVMSAAAEAWSAVLIRR